MQWKKSGQGFTAQEGGKTYTLTPVDSFLGQLWELREDGRFLTSGSNLTLVKEYLVREQRRPK